MRSAKLQNPAAIARIALSMLARISAPPTPENFAREYRLAAGMSAYAADEEQSAALESTQTLLSLIKTIRLTSTGLTHGIERFDGDLKTIFEDQDRDHPDGVRGLIAELAASRAALQESLQQSHRELEDTRHRLEQVTIELKLSRSQARVDPLTGAINRRGMDEIVAREISRARRLGTPLSLAILDIDHFKRINDDHGHDTGDQALIQLVAAIKSGLRDGDVVCRFGGEEFAIVLPDSGVHRGLFVLDRLRSAVEATPVKIAAHTLWLRFSAGVAELSANDDQDAFIRRADMALLAAKRAGRNRVYVGQPVDGAREQVTAAHE